MKSFTILETVLTDDKVKKNKIAWWGIVIMILIVLIAGASLVTNVIKVQKYNQIQNTVAILNNKASMLDQRMNKVVEQIIIPISIDSVDRTITVADISRDYLRRVLIPEQKTKGINIQEKIKK